ncbi:protein transport protein S31 [Apophysomyces sp. BC1034]|nr:protein transport protein S31 [Apophysomyces sp. BC1015]KAG0179460.1 protein transport protein S31 [Apophysomyces sp. BC1021]KAG0190044.1 protein transport protein S31 [Apophysomyces sp. BC1034]
MTKKVNEIHRTATFAWSPGHQQPFIAAGTVSGALDASFSNTSELEIYQLDFTKSTEQELIPAGKVSTKTRFNTLAWGNALNDNSLGVIAGGMESGELELWDPSAILENKQDALVLRNSTHSGALRTLDFNLFQTNLMGSGGNNNEIYIWDLNNPTKPYSPGTKSNKLGDITSLSWNSQVQHILATSSTMGYTVVWDLRNRKEVMALANSQGSVTANRRGVSAIAWHPDVATQIVAASEDDENPVITLWDLRHAHAPEKTLSGHQKGIMDVSWCRQDSDLLVSSSKDCKTLCWNPNSGELLGEVSQNTKWTFEVGWCPRNPDLLASASFDGKIDVFSIQGTEAPVVEKETAYANDPFSAAILNAAPTKQSFGLKQPPKWLRRPVGASFSFSGKLVSFSNKAGQAAAKLPAGSTLSPQNVPRRVTVATVVTEPEIVKRSESFETAIDQKAIETVVEERQKRYEQDKNELQHWEVLRTLFADDAREQLVRYLGFQKDQLVSAVADITRNKSAEVEPETSDEKSKEEISSEIVQENAGNETPVPTDTLSGLFRSSDTNSPEQEFFGQTSEQSTLTAASPLVSALNLEPLELYPSNGCETDRLITRSVVLGDFESAVELCLATDRLSDALLLAICGGGDLLARTQKAYFERQAEKSSYLRLLKCIVEEDLTAVVQTTSLDEWASVVAILCTFAQSGDFGPLCESLGSRLEKATGDEHVQHATLCYLAAGNFEKVVNIWVDQQEKSKDTTGVSLQNLIEKVTVFRQAIDFEDTDIMEQHSGEYRLAALYDKYCDYAELLATQGKLDIALKYIGMTPSNYQQSASERLSVTRDRVFRASSSGTLQHEPTFPFAKNTLGSSDTVIENNDTFAQTEIQQQEQVYETHKTYESTATVVPTAAQQQPANYAPATAYQPQTGYATQPYQAAQYSPFGQYEKNNQTEGYSNYAAGYGQYNNPYETTQPAPVTAVAPPPPPPKAISPPVAAQRTNATGAWNDPPMITSRNSTRSPAAVVGGPQRVVSPFPNMPAPTTFGPPPQQGSMPFVAQPPPTSIAPPPMNAAAPSHLARQPQIEGKYPPQRIRSPPPGQPPMRAHPAQPVQAMPQPGLPPTSAGPYAPHQQPTPPPAQVRSPVTPVAQSPKPAKVAAPAVPEKKRHPKDDRSHIPPEHRPIHQILMNEFQQTKQRAPAGQKKMYDDTERRLGSLFDQLNNNEVSEGVITSMQSLVQALQNRDYDSAQRIQVDLVTTRYDECGSWLVGVKRVIENAKQTTM